MARGSWDYAQAPDIAHDYDAEFATNQLFDYDQSVLERHFTRPGLLVDLGCGTGRLMVPFARRGFRTLGVDLSPAMLAIVGDKARAEGLPIDRLMANLVELDCLRDGCADYCICMFSTLGMVQGNEHRRRVVAHVWRLLRPGGLFVVHVHNRWYNLFNPQGRAWLVGNFTRWLAGRAEEPGDKLFPFRGIPQMYLHVFTRRELRRLVTESGFRIREFIALDTERRRPLRCPWLLGRVRANGWIVVAERT